MRWGQRKALAFAQQWASIHESLDLSEQGDELFIGRGLGQANAIHGTLNPANQALPESAPPWSRRVDTIRVWPFQPLFS